VDEVALILAGTRGKLDHVACRGQDLGGALPHLLPTEYPEIDQQVAAADYR